MPATGSRGAATSPDAAALAFEDLAIGNTFSTSTTEVTRADVLAFAERYDPQPFHTDPLAAETSFFGELVASGWHTAALTMSLVVREGFVFADGMVGLSGTIEWPTPTRPGDVLQVTGTVLSVRRSRTRPDRGFAEVRWHTAAADGGIRQIFTATILVFTRRAPG